jgi:hypothetical protein
VGRDKNTVVSQLAEDGKQLMGALVKEGFDVQAAFWMKPTDDEKWFLYLASPMVDDKGPAAAYRFVHRVLRNMSNTLIEPLEIKVLGLNDSITSDVLARITPKVANSPYAVRNPPPYRGMTWFGGATLGGISIDGAYIYPLSAVAAPN